MDFPIAFLDCQSYQRLCLVLSLFADFVPVRPKWHRLPDDSIFKGMTQHLVERNLMVVESLRTAVGAACHTQEV
jgi:hypothetical protein